MPLSPAKSRTAATATLAATLSSSSLSKDFYAFCAAAFATESLDFMHFVAKLGGNGATTAPKGLKPSGTPTLSFYTPARGKQPLLWLVEEFVRAESPRQINISGDTRLALITVAQQTDAAGAHGSMMEAGDFAAAYLETYKLLERDIFTRWRKAKVAHVKELDVRAERAHQLKKLKKHPHGRFKLYSKTADSSGEIVLVSSSMLKAINRASEASVKASDATLTEGYWIRDGTTYTVGPSGAAGAFQKAMSLSGLAGSAKGTTELAVKQMAPANVRKALGVKTAAEVSKDIDKSLAADARSSKPVVKKVHIADKVQTGRANALLGLEKGWEWLRQILKKTGNDKKLLARLQQRVPQLIQKAKTGALVSSDPGFKKLIRDGAGSYYSLVAYVDMSKPDLVSGHVELWLYRGVAKPSAAPSASAKQRWYPIWTMAETKDLILRENLESAGLMG